MKEFLGEAVGYEMFDDAPGDGIDLACCASQDVSLGQPNAAGQTGSSLTMMLILVGLGVLDGDGGQVSMQFARGTWLALREILFVETTSLPEPSWTASRVWENLWLAGWTCAEL